jgi:hypothetical protein
VDVVFGGGLWPIGQGVGFVELELAEALWQYERWAEAWEAPPSYRKLGKVPILEQLQELLPLEMPYTRRLLVDTKSGWTAIFDNSRGGGDLFPPVSYLSRSASARGLVAKHTPPAQYPYPATQFHLFGPDGEPPLMYVRTIDAGIFDSGRWQFLTSGPARPFENERRYGARRIRDRFTREMLIEYLAALGLRPDDPEWYGSGVLVVDEAGRPQWTASLEQARAEATLDLR